MKSTQVGSKFVITGGNMRDTVKGLYIRHHFPVGEVVTLVGGTYEDYGYYEDEKGYEQGVSDIFVKPFEEEEISVIKANVGDKFLVVDGDGAFELGETVTLTRYDGDGFNIYENASGKSRAVKDSRLRKKDSRLRKLDGVSVGDKFEVVSNNDDFHSFEEGTIVTVQHLCGDGIHGYVDEEGRTQYVMPRDLIPYVEKAVAAPVKGDKYIVTGNGSPTHYYDIGTEVTYNGYTSSSGSLSVSRGGDSLGQLINPRDLTAVAPEVKPEAQVGDYITIDFAAVERRTSPRTVDLTKGKAYLVEEDEDGELYFIDDVGDTRIQHIEHGLYDVVSSPIKEGDFVIALPSNPYYLTNENMTLGKVDRVESDGIRVEIIAAKPGTPSSSEIGSKFEVDTKHFRKATEAEIAAAMSPEEKAEGLKEGDFAEVIADGYSDSYKSHDLKLGTIVKVKRTTNYGRQKYEATPVDSEDVWESSRYFVEGDLRKVDAPVEEKKRPKVGDKIRITGNGYKNGGIFGPHYGKIGDIETVTGVRDDRVIVTNANAVHDDFYELVEEIVEEVDPYEGRGFSGEIRKKGDKVLVLRDEDYPELIGTIQEVSDAYDGSGGGNVELTNGKIVLGDHVELVEEVAEEVTFEEGDIVRITRDTSSQNREGDIGVVEMNDFGTIKVFVNARGNERNYHLDDSLELIAKARK